MSTFTERQFTSEKCAKHGKMKKISTYQISTNDRFTTKTETRVSLENEISKNLKIGPKHDKHEKTFL